MAIASQRQSLRKFEESEVFDDDRKLWGARAIDHGIHGIHGKGKRKRSCFWTASVYSVWSVVKKVYGFTLLAILC